MNIKPKIIYQQKIPTRFDDITAQIKKEKLQRYYEQTKNITDNQAVKTYKLGSVAADILAKILV